MRAMTSAVCPAGSAERMASASTTRLQNVTTMTPGQKFSTPRPPYAAWLGTVAGSLSLRRYAEEPDWKSIYVAMSGVM